MDSIETSEADARPYEGIGQRALEGMADRLRTVADSYQGTRLHKDPDHDQYAPAYAGHLPNGSGIQRHSAGELFPCIIVIYGNGEARWIDPEKRRASCRCASEYAHKSLRNYMRWRNTVDSRNSPFITPLRDNFLDYSQGN